MAINYHLCKLNGKFFPEAQGQKVIQFLYT